MTKLYKLQDSKSGLFLTNHRDRKARYNAVWSKKGTLYSDPRYAKASIKSLHRRASAPGNYKLLNMILYFKQWNMLTNHMDIEGDNGNL